MKHALMLALALPALIFAACDSKPAQPPAGGVGAAAPASPPATTPASIGAISGVWVVDMDATRKLMTDEAKVALVVKGQKLTDEQFKIYIDQAMESYRRADLETTVNADKTYVSTINGQKARGTILIDGDLYTFLPDTNAGVIRYKLIDGKLVSQRPADPQAQYTANVAKRK